MNISVPPFGSSLRPRGEVAEGVSYAIPGRSESIDLPLGNTERLVVSAKERKAFREIVSQLDVGTIISYPKACGLQQHLAERFNIGPEQVLVTAGAD